MGVESSTRSPLGVFCDQLETQNPLLQGGYGEDLPNAYMAMGLTAENVADRCSNTREEMDQYAVQSQNRGVRILTTLLNDLRTLDKTVGLETMCVGGGQGMALIVERLS